MMPIKFTFNNFLFYGVSAAAWQRASGIRRRRWRLWLAYPIMTSFRYVPYVSYFACVALDGRVTNWRAWELTDAVSPLGAIQLLAAICKQQIHDYLILEQKHPAVVARGELTVRCAICLRPALSSYSFNYIRRKTAYMDTIQQMLQTDGRQTNRRMDSLLWQYRSLHCVHRAYMQQT